MCDSGARKAPLSAKAIIHHKYGNKACYAVEEIVEHVENECPGLNILHQNRTRVTYQCRLQLPELSVTSEKFSKKKDAEQSAAKLAIEKLGIEATSKDPTKEDARDELVARISSLFSEKFCLSGHPMVGHLRVSMDKEGENKGLIPTSIIAALDSKIINLCKFLNPEAESDPLLIMSLVLNAARSIDSVHVSRCGLWIGRKDSYCPGALQSLINEDSSSMECLSIKALFFPASMEKPVEPLTLELCPKNCYIDEISQKLGAEDPSHILISRQVGKASSERRFYFSFPECRPLCLDSSSERDVSVDGSINSRASFFAGQNIYGNAILANVGYSWKSKLFFSEDVTLSTYYRMLLGLTPDGLYRISREAMLAVKLPSSFTVKSNWRGQYPKEILCTFCRNHRLMEPQFLVKTLERPENSAMFVCEVKIYGKSQDLILEYSGEACKKQTDSIQKAALTVLQWFSQPRESPNGVNVDFGKFSSEFSLSSHILSHLHEDDESSDSVMTDAPNSGLPLLVAGSLVSIMYSVSLVNEDGEERHRILLESKEELEFEFGSSGVINSIESCVSKMGIYQSTQLIRRQLPCKEIILLAAGDLADVVSGFDLRKCWLEYSLKLLQISEPNEDRLERALFNPSLSKQRVDFALGFVNGSSASTLVDFGCGSGSLLEPLMDHQTTLDTIVGVDISQRSLCRAAKVLHAKLTKNGGNSIKKVLLYDGSILEYDSRVQGFDVGTCLEVIEHMEEDQAVQFGHVALNHFCPKVLIVSTPNYEYNPLLQAEEDQGEKSTLGPARFRNHDHKFEWTRAQFESWAVELTSKYPYSVDFAGVGGSGDVDPGFASQIAIFRRLSSYTEGVREKDAAVKPYDILWEWPTSSLPSQ